MIYFGKSALLEDCAVKSLKNHFQHILQLQFLRIY